MQKLWSVNVEGTFYVAAAVARHLMQRGASGASMVFIGSMSGSGVNVPQAQTPYNASKAAVRQMARSLAVEWAGWGVRVNCVSPGYVRTRL
jgi:D-arabinitol 2-dehydrogenase